MRERVVVAMSGGVDSSVAAALLQSQGYEAIGITMCFSLAEVSSKKPRCCGLQGIEDARRVAHKLGIKHYVLNMRKVLQQRVIEDFCLQYLKGRTPNPCIRCNQYVKFGALLQKALSLGAKYLATGHYARIIRARQGYCLKKAKDLRKDQSYFLYRLGQMQLRHILFPLGDYMKAQVRELARQFSLPVAEKTESQEICFLPQDDYRAFLRQNCADKVEPPRAKARGSLPEAETHPSHAFIPVLKPRGFLRRGFKIKPGPVLDAQGKTLGTHKGVAFYTIGQREGLGIAVGYPLYVTKIDLGRNQLIVAGKDQAYKRDFLVKNAHFAGRPLKKRIALKVKIRYNHQEALAEILPEKGNIRIHFKKPQFAITPGQSAVFYQKDTVLGGAIISEVLD